MKSPFHSITRWFAFIVCAVALPVAASAANNALQFDGVNDHVTFGAAPGLGVPAFTIECWFKRTGAGVATSTGSGGVTAVPLVTKGRSEADGTAQDMNYFLGIRATDSVLVADFEEGAGGASPGLNHPIAGVTPVSNNVWYHAAATYDGTTWRLYLNGVQDAQLVVSRPPRADSIQHAALGSALNSTGVASGFFLGALDEARIWNYARSAQNVADNVAVEISNAPGLLGRWGLNEGTGTVAADSSGSGINGTLVNGPVWTTGFVPGGGVAVTRGPYLQMGTPTSVVVRWRTNTATNSRVQYGTSAGSLTSTQDDATSTTEHQVTLTGLAADTQYWYSVGSTTTTLATGTEFNFFTSPPVGTAQPTRIWVLGDSGTKDAVAASVRNGYTTYADNRNTDVWLMLGDNAYNNGTDAEYQSAVFDMYPSYLRQSVLWSTIGNHDTAGSANPNISTTPYFSIFNLPTAGEAGGQPSGTEKYYSFDYGRIHFICLDAMTSSRAVGSPMLTWLQADIAATSQDWIIAFWHHPPYTKGSHNSDTETQLIEMRGNVLPILEAGGVDLVLCGHSHCYERSYLLNGHYGLSTTLTPAMKVDAGDGREDGTGAYLKPGGLAGNSGAVYVVAGNGGHATYWNGGSTAQFNPTPHPAMYFSELRVGSVVIDVDGNRLDMAFVRETGAVDDRFTILKPSANQPPTVNITVPANGATFTAPANISVTASATDTDGTVAQVDFYANAVLIGSDASAPFSVNWNGVSTGSYALTAIATDNLGAATTSAVVNIAVNIAPPAAPTGLTATAGNAQVALAWSASAGATTYNVKRAGVSGGPYTVIATGIGATSHTDTTAMSGTTYFYAVSAVNAGGQSANSNEASATPLPGAPLAPTGLAATAGDAQVALVWSASVGANSYNVKRATTSGGPYTTIASVATTSHTDTTAANGTTYFYVTSAVNLGGESANSNQASATPMLPPPPAPTGLAATAGNAQVALTWNASAAAASYSVKRATVSGGPYTTIASVATTSHTDTTAANGTTYFYVVSAVNLGGESANSSQASATPATPIPAAPSSLTATAVSRTRINLAWTDHSTNESGFRIERSTNGTTFTQIASVGAGVTTYASTGLKRNTPYWYRVRAYNANGNSGYSNTATATTLP